MSSMLRTNGWNDFAAGTNFYGSAIQFAAHNKDKQNDGIAPQDLQHCPQFVNKMSTFDTTDAIKFGIRTANDLDAYVCKTVNAMFNLLKTDPRTFQAMVQKSDAAIRESFDKQARSQQEYAEVTVKAAQQSQYNACNTVSSTTAATSTLALAETPRADSTMAMIRAEVSNKAASSDLASRIVALANHESQSNTEAVTVVERTNVVYKKVFVKDFAARTMLAILFVVALMHVVFSMDAPSNPCNTLFGSAPEGCFPS